MPKKKDKSGGGGSNATTPQRKLSDDYSSTPTSPSNHVNPGDSYLLKARQPNDQSNIVIVQKILQSAFTSYGLSSIDSLTTQNEAARFGARAANFFRFIYKMKPSPKAAKLQMVRDILTFPKQFTAADLEKAIEDSPFVQRLVERADQDPSSLLVGQKEFLDMWRYETGGIHPLRVTFVQTAFDHIQSLENAWISGCMSQLSSSATSAGELRAVTAYECCLQGQTTLQCQETGYWYDTFSEQFWGRITTDAGDQRRHNQSKFDSYLTKFEQLHIERTSTRDYLSKGELRYYMQDLQDRIYHAQSLQLYINDERLLNMIINLLEAGAVLHLVPTDEDQTTYGEVWSNLDRFLSNAGIGRDAGRIRNEDGKFHRPTSAHASRPLMSEDSAGSASSGRGALFRNKNRQVNVVIANVSDSSAPFAADHWSSGTGDFTDESAATDSEESVKINDTDRYFGMDEPDSSSDEESRGLYDINPVVDRFIDVTTHHGLSEFHSLGHQLCRDPILKALRNKETFSSPKLGNNVITFDFSKLSPLQYSQLSPAVQRAYQQYNNILKTEGGYVPPPAAPVIRRGGAPRKVRKGAN